MLPLVLYDVQSELPGNNWSRNPAKPRFVLSYKNLPFKTVWFEYIDIRHKLQEVGASPNKLRDGSERCTVPVLSDPNTGALITDSWAIAKYLDETYPEKPIFPHGSKGLINAFDSAIEALIGAAFRFGFLRTSEILSERSREYFVASRRWDITFGVKADELSPEGPVRDAHWAMIEKDFYGSARMWYEQVEGKWVMGNAFSYADILIATHTLWFKRVFKADEWKRVASLHDGKWAKQLDEVEKECNLDQTSTAL